MRKVQLLVMVGLPGSGKSTYAKKVEKVLGKSVIISSDGIREENNLNPRSSEDNKETFKIFDLKLKEALNNEEIDNIILDATHVSYKDRRRYIDLKGAQGKKGVELIVHCIIMAPTIEECIRRDSERERSVGRDVIINMAKRFNFPQRDERDSYHIVKSQTYEELLKEHQELKKEFEVFEQDNSHHTLTLGKHMEKAEEYAIEKGYNIKVSSALRFHDYGKYYTKSFTDSRGNPTEEAHYYSHNNVSSYMYTAFVADTFILLEDLVNDDYMCYLIEKHMLVFEEARKPFQRAISLGWDGVKSPFNFDEDIKAIRECDRLAK